MRNEGRKKRREGMRASKEGMKGRNELTVEGGKEGEMESAGRRKEDGQ